MKLGSLVVLVIGTGAWCVADDFIQAPEPGPTETTTLYLFLLNQAPAPPPVPTARYQQVYDSSLFTSADPRSIYVTTLQFLGVPREEFGAGTVVRSVQVNLSTTPMKVDGLSMVFSENVGPDDTTVFGPANCTFAGGLYRTRQLVLFERPFRFDGTLGNLLLDVRVFDSSGYVNPMFPIAHAAYYSPTDTVSRVWATNVAAVVADRADSTGLSTVIQLSPVPSLGARLYPLYAGAFTNIIEIRWPSQPSTFVLQRTERLGPEELWTAVTNQIGGSPQDQYRWIQFPAASAGSMGYYRLVWPSGP